MRTNDLSRFIFPVSPVLFNRNLYRKSICFNEIWCTLSLIKVSAIVIFINIIERLPKTDSKKYIVKKKAKFSIINIFYAPASKLFIFLYGSLIGMYYRQLLKLSKKNLKQSILVSVFVA